MRIEETMDEFPPVPPARRKLAQDAYEQGLRGQRAAEYWRRVEIHASRIMAVMTAGVQEGMWSAYAMEAVAAARELVAELDRQRAAEEPGT